jgi:hypothetical protein
MEEGLWRLSVGSERFPRVAALAEGRKEGRKEDEGRKMKEGK